MAVPVFKTSSTGIRTLVEDVLNVTLTAIDVTYGKAEGIIDSIMILSEKKRV